jgi:hypothetical protein
MVFSAAEVLDYVGMSPEEEIEYLNNQAKALLVRLINRYRTIKALGSAYNFVTIKGSLVCDGRGVRPNRCW